MERAESEEVLSSRDRGSVKQAANPYMSRESAAKSLNPQSNRNQNQVPDPWSNNANANANAAPGWQLPKSAQDDVNYADFLPDVYVSNPVPGTSNMPEPTSKGL